ncbi:MAG: PBP1A family penicillin-binding protein [Deltaproteobacteria bacterium]|nr:PBP1A family penicillin-binding protein [Deltaproteobacteria bacterium]
MLRHPLTILFSRVFLGILTAVLVWGGLCFPVRGEEPVIPYPLLSSRYNSIKVFDIRGQFVGRILAEKRYWVPIERIPVFLQNALVAIEDARFYEHSGIDIRGIARALVKDVMKGRMAEGGSTITQQLIKNKYLSQEKTLQRKVKEGLLAMEYERKYSKKKILEMYFNEVFFGNGAWGIAQASRLYFDKNPEELNEAECALLAGVPKAPSRYNPLGDSQKVRERRNLVIKRMVELNMVPGARGEKLKAAPISIIKPGEAPYYLEHLRQKLQERFGPEIVEGGGLEVTCPMDLELQRLAERVISLGVPRLNPELQGALICLDPETGNVLAAVGGVDFKKSPYNRAFYAKRQPGSAIKPLIYAAALDSGQRASSLWDDTPVAYNRGNGEKWTPLNYERKLDGTVTLRKALAFSNNIITVKLLEAIGVPFMVEYAARLGLSLRSPNDLSLALGTEEVTLSELVQAYVPLVNQGQRVEARTILRIYDRNRQTWLEDPLTSQPAIPPETAYLVTQMLRDVLRYGTGKTIAGFAQERPAAGKTGTTDDYRDAWFIGYTPQLIAGVWVGHDKPRPGGRGFTGGAVCAPLWARFMEGALKNKPVMDFTRPEGVVTALIDPQNEALANPECPIKQEEVYRRGTEPLLFCPQHGGRPSGPPANGGMFP